MRKFMIHEKADIVNVATMNIKVGKSIRGGLYMFHQVAEIDVRVRTFPRAQNRPAGIHRGELHYQI